jgi:DNA-binding SARP family transcriptional activator/tetratricopeptide (TPR) repeat protein
VALPASKRTRALLGYLAATGRPHRRSHLCDLLWESPGDPRAALRWSLAKLRPVLEPDRRARLRADREHVELDLDGIALDLAGVREVGARGPDRCPTDALRAAAESFHGEFLDGLELPDCYRFNEWCVAEREALRGLRVQVLGALVARLADRPDEALVFARTRVGIDPLSEDAHADVVRLLGALGRPRDALRQYEACRRILRSELGLAPSEGLERARRELGTGGSAEGTPRPEPGPAPEPLAPSVSGLVGRASERALIDETMVRAAAGTAAALVFVGEPGIGKTRLLDEVEAAARARGGLALRGRAFEAEAARPYGAFIDALRTLDVERVPAPLRRELAVLLPELGPPPDDTAPGRIFDAVARLLAALAEQHPPVALCLDDLQWLDAASGALLHYVARAPRAAGFVLAGAARPGELPDNAEVHRLLRTLVREQRLREVAVGPLGAEDTARLAGAVHPGADVARVFAESGGHPLFAIEVARALARDGRTRSDTLSGLIEDRLARLHEDAQDVLPWAAALGRGFDLETLATLMERPAAELLVPVETLERHRVLRETAAAGAVPGYEFGHDLLREGAYRALSAPRRRLVHLRIARVLAEQPDPDQARAGEVARHADLGGDSRLAAEAGVRAGERGRRLFAHAEAAELADRARVHVAALPEPERWRLEARRLRLYVHSAMTRARSDDVEPRLQALITEAQAKGLADVEQAAFDVLTMLHWWRGDLLRAHQEALRAVETGRRHDPAQAALSLGMLARCLAHLERDLPEAERLAQRAEALARGAGIEIVDGPWSLGLVHTHAGDYDRAVAMLERALALGRAQGNTYAEWDCQMRLAMIGLERGRPQAALGFCQGAADLVKRMGEGSEPVFTAAIGALARYVMDEAGAAEELATAVEALRRIDSRWMLAFTQAFAAEADEGRGRAREAEDRARDALASAQAVERRSEEARARAVLGGLALVRGDRAEAEAHWRALEEALREPRGLSARARDSAARLAGALRKTVPTVDTTGAPTPRP